MRARLGIFFATVAVASLTTVLAAGSALGIPILLPAPTVAPPAGPPGTTFLVAGTGCNLVGGPSIEDVSATAIFNNVNVEVQFASGPVSQIVPASLADGGWEAQFTVPEGEPDGERVVQASCALLAPLSVESTSEVGTLGVADVPYPAVSFTVTAAAAEAVVAQPRTTG